MRLLALRLIKFITRNLNMPIIFPLKLLKALIRRKNSVTITRVSLLNNAVINGKRL
jgi:hypothetical protein